jgi:hypothetical protein
MNIMKEIIKKFIPEFILSQKIKYHQKKRDKKTKRKLDKLKQDIIHYLESNPESDTLDKKQKILDHLRHNTGLPVFPYEYTKNYKPENVVVYEDNEKGLRYVLQDGRRLYFKKGWDENKVQVYYNGLLKEQDAASPHRYETADFHVSEGDVVVDAGVAEGNFALSVIEKVRKIYLFEVDEAWISALEVTFAPWKEKVVIVNKYVSDNDKEKRITLDVFFGNEKIDFIKADIEGAEPQLIEGAKTILSRQSPMKVTLCTYHRHNDADTLNRMLTEKGFHTEFSKGHMIFFYDRFLDKPFLRRGLIRAVKN